MTSIDSTHPDQPVEIEKTNQTHQDLLSQLPDEVLLEIIRYLFNIQNESDRNHQNKLKQTITLATQQTVLSLAQQTGITIYQHNPTSPILTSFQSFSIINQRIFKLCRPLLWQTLTFWPAMYRPINYWNQELLPKYGSYVKELNLTLNKDWLKIPNPNSIKLGRDDKAPHSIKIESSNIYQYQFIESLKECSPGLPFEKLPTHVQKNIFGVEHGIVMFKDNGLPPGLSFERLPPHVKKSVFGVEHGTVMFKDNSLPPQDMVKILSQCKSITTLRLDFSDQWEYPTSEEMHHSTLHFTSLFSNLHHLQHIKISGATHNFMFNPLALLKSLTSHLAQPQDPDSSVPGSTLPKCFIEPLTCLPLLESLELVHLTLGHPNQVDQSLSTCFSNLKHLKKLVLKRLKGRISSWICPEGLPNLVELVMIDCICFELPEVLLFINSWAPHLTSLTLRVYDLWDPALEDDLSEFDPIHDRFCLPDLKDLTIWSHSKSHYLQCFSDCRNLSNLIFFLSTNDEEEIEGEESEELANQLSSLSELIITNQFPSLKSVDLRIDDDDQLDLISDSILLPLELFCESNDIQFSGIKDI